jgi:hypothetical protein
VSFHVSGPPREQYQVVATLGQAGEYLRDISIDQSVPIVGNLRCRNRFAGDNLVLRFAVHASNHSVCGHPVQQPQQGYTRSGTYFNNGTSLNCARN